MQVYLRGLPRQLSSEELRAERVGFQVHPQPWFRRARPLTRSNETLGRGTASSMRREMSGDSSARVE